MAVILFVYRKLQIKFKWDTERWEGLIAAGFLAGEKSGMKTGNEKLDVAIKKFTEQFVATFGKEPSTADLRDAALDLAKMAFAMKFKPAAVGGVITTNGGPA